MAHCFDLLTVFAHAVEADSEFVGGFAHGIALDEECVGDLSSRFAPLVKVGDDIRDARIVKASDESLDALADDSWWLIGELGDRACGATITKDGQHELAICGFEPVCSVDDVVGE